MNHAFKLVRGDAPHWPSSWTIRQPIACGREVRVLILRATPEEWRSRPEASDSRWTALMDGDHVIGVRIDG